MRIPRRILLLSLLTLMAFPAVLFAKSKQQTEIFGSVFQDANKNGRFNGQEKTGKAKVWLYRILPNGRRKKIETVTTDGDGRYSFGGKPAGKYFIAVRYTNKFSVRSNVFVLNGKGRNRVRNFPVVNRQTVNRYNFLTQIANPANLNSEPGTSPFAPGT